MLDSNLEIAQGKGLRTRSDRAAGWNPLLELHQPEQLRRTPPELFDQRDIFTATHLKWARGR